MPLTEVEPLTALDTLFNYESSIDLSIDEKNRVVVVWEQNTPQRFVSKIYGRCFRTNGTPLGNAFKVSTDSSAINSEIFPNAIARNGLIYTTFTLWSDGDVDTATEIAMRILNIDTVISDSSVEPPITPTRTFFLYQNYPNPFNPTTKIKFYLESTQEVTLQISNVVGQEEKLLMSGILSAGTYSTTWDGRNSRGILLPSGVYLATLRVGNNTITRKIMLLR